MNRVLVVPVPQFGEGAHVIYSASKREDDGVFGDFRVKNHFSFCFINGDYAAEWEPQYGPIQIWHKCNKDTENSREHYIFEYTDSDGGNWSQMAVDRHDLPRSAHIGSWQYIFNVLKDWTDR